MIASASGQPAACERCLRRSWLLAALSVPLEYCARDRARLIDVLALPDEQLLKALGGRRKRELGERYERFHPDELARMDGVEAVCRHDPRFPQRLQGAQAPQLLNVAGGADRLGQLAATPIVALLGSTRASDYGMEMAKSLARGLAASGITVAGSLADGIAVAAHIGALEVGAPTLAVIGGGLAASCPTRRHSLCKRIVKCGCLAAELPCDCRGRLWGARAGERILVGVAELAVVVEAEESPQDLSGAHTARDLGRPVAAMPGRVTSRLSQGSHALLMAGAELVRRPQDVLELLCIHGASGQQERPATDQPVALDPRLRATLARVGAGSDTPDKLIAAGGDPAAVLMDLSELELLGLLARGDGGRYVPRDALIGR